MSEAIRINTGIKKYEILNENDETVAELVIDTNDTHLLNKFIELYDNAQKISEECRRRHESLGLDEKDGITTEDAKSILEINETAVNEMIEEIEKMFGKGLILDVFAEHHKLNSNFVPDISLIQGFFEQIMPIVHGIFEKKSKYSPNKTGKC